MGRLVVIEPGLLSTIQDGGRPGYRKFGVPTSGALDHTAFECVNRLTGNPVNAPVIELTMTGGRFEFESETMIAVTGANMHPERNGIPMPLNRSVKMKAGDILAFGRAGRGCRSYLGVRGQINADKVMGSYSTCLAGKFGGLHGRKLQKGDVITWADAQGAHEPKEVPKNEIPFYESDIVTEIYAGPEWNWLNEEARDAFLNSRFIIASGSNRMGIRLEGAQLTAPEKEMKSSPVIPGIVQLPPDGNPIILHYDGQTMGGYPRVAKVADNELWRLGQLLPGNRIRFRLKSFGS